MADVEVSSLYIAKELKGKPQDPNGVTFGPDAPETVQFGGEGGDCCTPLAPKDTKKLDPQGQALPEWLHGVEVSFSVSYRGQNGNPVDRVRVMGLDYNGDTTSGQIPGIWDLSQAEKN